jgi:predicted site-specific integrase-resolvase
MTTDDLKVYYGGVGESIAALSISKTAFYQWVRNGYIPYKRQVMIEKLTNGNLKADNANVYFEKIKKFKEAIFAD